MTRGRPAKAPGLSAQKTRVNALADGGNLMAGCLAVSTERVQPGGSGNRIGPDLHHGVRDRLHALEQLHPPAASSAETGLRRPACRRNGTSRPPRSSTRRRGSTTDEDEQADHPIGADPQRDDAEQHRDLGAGTQHHIGDDQAGDRARGADQLDPRMRVIGDENQPADDAAKKIEERDSASGRAPARRRRRTPTGTSCCRADAPISAWKN